MDQPKHADDKVFATPVCNGSVLRSKLPVYLPYALREITKISYRGLGDKWSQILERFRLVCHLLSSISSTNGTQFTRVSS